MASARRGVSRVGSCRRSDDGGLRRGRDAASTAAARGDRVVPSALVAARALATRADAARDDAAARGVRLQSAARADAARRGRRFHPRSQLPNARHDAARRPRGRAAASARRSCATNAPRQPHFDRSASRARLRDAAELAHDASVAPRAARAPGPRRGRRRPRTFGVRRARAALLDAPRAATSRVAVLFDGPCACGVAALCARRRRARGGAGRAGARATPCLATRRRSLAARGVGVARARPLPTRAPSRAAGTSPHLAHVARLHALLHAPKAPTRRRAVARLRAARTPTSTAPPTAARARARVLRRAMRRTRRGRRARAPRARQAIRRGRASHDGVGAPTRADARARRTRALAARRRRPPRAPLFAATAVAAGATRGGAGAVRRPSRRRPRARRVAADAAAPAIAAAPALPRRSRARRSPRRGRGHRSRVARAVAWDDYRSPRRRAERRTSPAGGAPPVGARRSPRSLPRARRARCRPRLRARLRAAGPLGGAMPARRSGARAAGADVIAGSRASPRTRPRAACAAPPMRAVRRGLRRRLRRAQRDRPALSSPPSPLALDMRSLLTQPPRDEGRKTPPRRRGRARVAAAAREHLVGRAPRPPRPRRSSARIAALPRGPPPRRGCAASPPRRAAPGAGSGIRDARERRLSAADRRHSIGARRSRASRGSARGRPPRAAASTRRARGRRAAARARAPPPAARARGPRARGECARARDAPPRRRAPRARSRRMAFARAPRLAPLFMGRWRALVRAAAALVAPPAAAAAALAARATGGGVEGAATPRPRAQRHDWRGARERAALGAARAPAPLLAPAAEAAACWRRSPSAAERRAARRLFAAVAAPAGRTAARRRRDARSCAANLWQRAARPSLHIALRLRAASQAAASRPPCPVRLLRRSRRHPEAAIRTTGTTRSGCPRASGAAGRRWAVLLARRGRAAVLGSRHRRRHRPERRARAGKSLSRRGGVGRPRIGPAAARRRPRARFDGPVALRAVAAAPAPPRPRRAADGDRALPPRRARARRGRPRGGVGCVRRDGAASRAGARSEPPEALAATSRRRARAPPAPTARPPPAASSTATPWPRGGASAAAREDAGCAFAAEGGIDGPQRVWRRGSVVPSRRARAGRLDQGRRRSACGLAPRRPRRRRRRRAAPPAGGAGPPMRVSELSEVCVVVRGAGSGCVAAFADGGASAPARAARRALNN